MKISCNVNDSLLFIMEGTRKQNLGKNDLHGLLTSVQWNMSYITFVKLLSLFEP